jgi:surface antigen
MKKRKIASLILIASIITGCAEQGGPLNKQGIGTVLGGATGALLGAQFGKGKGQLLGVAVGALAGAAIGNSIGASLDKADQQYMQNTSQNALETVRVGQTSQWRNPDSGNSGTITPTNTFKTDDGRYCREYNQTVTVGGKTEKAYGKACRQPDGSWQIVS